MTQWRTVIAADAMSVEGSLSLSSDGHLLSARDLGLTIAELVDDFDQQTRVPPFDIGADEFCQSELLLRNWKLARRNWRGNWRGHPLLR